MARRLSDRPLVGVTASSRHGWPMWLFNKKRADLVAQSISQLIHTLAAGR